MPQLVKDDVPQLGAIESVGESFRQEQHRTQQAVQRGGVDEIGLDDEKPPPDSETRLHRVDDLGAHVAGRRVPQRDLDPNRRDERPQRQGGRSAEPDAQQPSPRRRPCVLPKETDELLGLKYRAASLRRRECSNGRRRYGALPERQQIEDAPLRCRPSRQGQPQQYHEPECMPPARADLPSDEPLKDRHQHDDDRALDRRIDDEAEECEKVRFVHFFSSFRLRSRIARSSRKSASESSMFSTMCTSAGVVSPPKTRSMNERDSTATKRSRGKAGV